MEFALFNARLLRPQASGPPLAIFDAGRQPVLRFEGQPAPGAVVEWALGSAAPRTRTLAEAEVRTVGERTYRFLRLKIEGPPPAADGASESLAVRVLDAQGTPLFARTLGFAQAPEATPGVREIVGARRVGDLDGARRALSQAERGAGPEVALWLCVERARIAQQAGDAPGAVQAWAAAAEAAHAAGLPGEEARRLRAEANFLIALRRFDEADRLLDRAVALAAPLGDEEGLAHVRLYRGMLEAETGRMGRALDNLEAALAGAQSRGATEDADGIARVLAIRLQDQGRHAEALATLESVRADFEARGANDPTYSDWLNDLGWARLRAMAAGHAPPDYGAASRLFRDALSALGPGGGRGPRANLALNLAYAAMLAGDVAGGRAELRRIEPDRDALTGLERAFAAWLDAALLAAGGDGRSAVAAFDVAEREARAEGAGLPTDPLWRAQMGRAEALGALGRLDEAETAYRTAERTYREVVRQAPLQGGRAPYLDAHRPPTQALVALLVRRGRHAEALAVLDAARAALFDDLAVAARLSALDADRLAAWRRLVAEHQATRAAYQLHARDARTLGPEGRAAWTRAQPAAAAAIAHTFDAAFALLGERPPAPVPDRPAGVRPPDRAQVLAFGRLADGWHAFLAGPSAVTHRGPEAPEALLAWGAEAALGLPDLYVVDGGLPGARDLGDRAVSGQALGGRVTLRFLPAASALQQTPAAPNGPALLVADPDGTLPEADVEAGMVAAHVPGAIALSGTDATPNAVLAALDGARLFHFAGHGRLTEAGPFSAHLGLARGTSLSLADLLLARPRTGRVVLSGCETGVSPRLAGDEQLGLPEAFLALGATSVLANTRPVSDAVARAFMTDFYAQGGADRPAWALREVTARTGTAGYLLMGR